MSESDRNDFYWQSPRWQDVRFPATGINPIGAAADPTIETDLDAVPGSLLFSATQDSYIDDAALSDSATFCFALRRLATDPADTYAGTARLLELDWHVRLIAAGSEDEFPT